MMKCLALSTCAVFSFGSSQWSTKDLGVQQYLDVSTYSTRLTFYAFGHRAGVCCVGQGDLWQTLESPTRVLLPAWLVSADDEKSKYFLNKFVEPASTLNVGAC